VTLIAGIPILLALLLLVCLRWPAVLAMPICAGVTAVSAYWLWQMPLIRIVASVVEAVWVTVSILLIVFGALFFLNLLRQTGAIAVLQRSVGRLSSDARIQAVLVGWTLGSFLEGGAGFGTPAAITAPLLIGLGFRPLQAVVVALVGDSTAVSFGAVGTPMIIGMGEGLGQASGAPAVNEIAYRIAALDLILGTLMPGIVVLTLVLSSEGVSAWRRALPALPFALLIGLTQAMTSWAVVANLGLEFPSLIGPMAGFVTAIILLRFKWLLPRDQWLVANHDSESASHSQPDFPTSAFPPWLAFAPYLLLLVLLVLTRTRALPLAAWLSSLTVGLQDLFGTGISPEVQPLYSPGTIFVCCTLISAWFFGAGWRTVAASARSAGQITLQTSVALIAAIVTVRIFLQSGEMQAAIKPCRSCSPTPWRRTWAASGPPLHRGSALWDRSSRGVRPSVICCLHCCNCR